MADSSNTRLDAAEKALRSLDAAPDGYMPASVRARYERQAKVALDAADEAERPGVERLVAALADLIDPDECWFDHHGGCQAHVFLSLEPGEVCPNQVAKNLLAEFGQQPTGDDS